MMMPEWTAIFDPSGRGVPLTWLYVCWTLATALAASLAAVCLSGPAPRRFVRAHPLKSAAVFFAFWLVSLYAAAKGGPVDPPPAPSAPAGRITLYQVDGAGRLVPIGAPLRRAAP